MEDATDFSWASAKASHAVLLCSYATGLGGLMPKSTHPTKQIGLKFQIPKSLGSARPFRQMCVDFKKIMRSVARHIGTFARIACLRAE